jgi:hypothetical protein
MLANGDGQMLECYVFCIERSSLDRHLKIIKQVEIERLRADFVP